MAGKREEGSLGWGYKEASRRRWKNSSLQRKSIRGWRFWKPKAFLRLGLRSHSNHSSLQMVQWPRTKTEVGVREKGAFVLAPSQFFQVLSYLFYTQKVKESEVTQSCLTLRPHGLQPTRLLHPWNFLGKSTGVGCHFLLQGIFPTQGLSLGLPHCRQTLYHLIHQGIPIFNTQQCLYVNPNLPIYPILQF